MKSKISDWIDFLYSVKLKYGDIDVCMYDNDSEEIVETSADNWLEVRDWYEDKGNVLFLS